MEVILKKYHKDLGEKNDIVSVKPGFARNFLIPQGIAIMATETNRKILTENLRQAAHKKDHIKNEALRIAGELEKLTLTISTLAGPDGRLFGSITPLMIANQLEAKGYDIERPRILFDTVIKELGNYEITVDLHKEVKAKVKIEVVAAAK
ncbi:MAG: 50S ribosomal protein L9 [Bacteroidetes bacterium]|jgi:large subunit ribosomal protein L9|nr:50S ribosomal protein L9 [Bacteroidota bacterium]